MNKRLYISPDIEDINVCFESGFGISSDRAKLDFDYEDEILADD